MSDGNESVDTRLRLHFFSNESVVRTWKLLRCLYPFTRRSQVLLYNAPKSHADITQRHTNN